MTSLDQMTALHKAIRDLDAKLNGTLGRVSEESEIHLFFLWLAESYGHQRRNLSQAFFRLLPLGHGQSQFTITYVDPWLTDENRSYVLDLEQEFSEYIRGEALDALDTFRPRKVSFAE